MQEANYNETNGIIVGPEISRIFAEIILQRIDRDVFELLKEDGLEFGVDYVVKRYVDDYFVFANDHNLIDKIYNLFQERLEKYKLYVNESKNEKLDVPFITGITIAKNELNSLIDEIFSDLINQKTENGEDNTKDYFL